MTNTAKQQENNPEDAKAPSLHLKDNELKSKVSFFNFSKLFRGTLPKTDYNLSMLFSVWVAIVFLIYSFSTPFLFEPVQTDLNFIFGAIFTLLTLVAWTLSMIALFPAVRMTLQHSRLSISLMAAIFLLYAMTITVLWIVENGRDFLITLEMGFLTIASAVIMLFIYCRTVLFNLLIDRAGMRFDRVSDTKIISESTANNLSIKEDNFDVSAVAVGSLLSFTSNVVVSHDCLIVEGVARVYERDLSGSGVWLHKQAGDVILAGSYILKGKLLGKVHARSQDARITTLMPATPDLVDSGNASSVFIAVCLFFACFSVIYWREQGLQSDVIEPMLGSILALGFMADWFWLRRIPNILARGKLFFRGLIVSSNSLISKMLSSKELFVRIATQEDLLRPVVDQIEILDDRIDNVKLYGLLEALAGIDASDQKLKALSEYFSYKLNDNNAIIELSDCISYPEGNVSANYQGAELSLGSEGFLIERGVHILSTQVKLKAVSNLLIYLAIGDQLVAAIKFVKRPTVPAKQIKNAQKNLLLKPQLISSLKKDQLDPIAKEMGIDLAYVHAEQSNAAIIKRVQVKTNTVVFDSVNDELVPSRYNNEKILRVGHFDLLNFDPYRFDVSLLNSNLGQLLSGLKDLKSMKSLGLFIDLVFPIIFITLAICGFIGFLWAELTITIVATLVLLAAALLITLAPNFKKFR